MKTIVVAISAALLCGSVTVGSAAVPALPKASPLAEQEAVSEVHYRYGHRYRYRYDRCYTTYVKRYHHWVRVTRCRW